MAAVQDLLLNSQQRSNIAKLGKLLFEEGTVILRSLFDRYVAPLTLKDSLRSKIGILRSLRRRNLVSPEEWKILFPDDGSFPSSQMMEAHLLFVLLQNICGLPKPSTGWDKTPETSDEGNDVVVPGNLAKWKSLTSEIARQTTLFGVENMCFNFYWSEITNVVSTLGFELPLREELKHQPMSKDDEDKYIRLLVEWKMRKIPNQDVAAYLQETTEKINSVLRRQDETKLQLMQDSKMPFTWSKSSIIGFGCIGTVVYYGHLTSNSQKVAVKKMFKGVFDMDEAVKLQRCKHPNIIHCFAIHEEEDFFYLALELGEKTLMVCINENMFDSNDGDLLIEKCFVEVASGVAYLHKNNISHRDIKPDNILLMANNDKYFIDRFVVADFNCVRDVSIGETISTQSRFGTPGWMAPEVCGVGCLQTLKADIFSLGCVYYYVITKKHPYGGDGETLTECQNNINKKQSPLNYMKHFGNYKHFSELLLRMIHADVEKRPAASEVLEHLESSKKQKNVTKGARKKIFINIQKLSERSDVLQTLEKDVLQVGKLQDVLNEMRQILITPIKPFSPPAEPVTTMTNGLPHPDDLPSQITRVLGKAFTQILVSRADEENCSLYLHLLDKALANEAFTINQKKRFQSWKQQCLKLVRSQFTRRLSQEKGPRGWCHMSHGLGDSTRSIIGSPAGPGVQTGKRHGGTCVRRSNKDRQVNQIRSNSAEQTIHQKPQLTRTHAIIGRTKSLPVKPTQQHSFSLPQQQCALDGIVNSLQTLCLRVLERALEDPGGN